MQEKKHPLLAFLMPPAVGGATLRMAGACVCRLRRRAGLLLAQAFATLRVAWLIALRRDRDAVSLSCSCKKVTKEHAKGGDAHTPQPPLESPFGCLCDSQFYCGAGSSV